MLGFYLSLIDRDDDKNKFEQLYLTYRQDMYKIAYSILKKNGLLSGIKNMLQLVGPIMIFMV